MNENAPPAVFAAGLLVECWTRLPYADRGPPRRVRFSSIVVIGAAQPGFKAFASVAEVDVNAT